MSTALPSRAAVIVGVVALSLISHRYIEQPLRRRIRQFGTPTKREEPVMVTNVAQTTPSAIEL